MAGTKSYFFCGIGGSGMLPLASILRGRGHNVAGSDRSRDQGRTGAKFGWLEAQGVKLFPQDGSGVTSPDQVLVTSAAVEEHIPDVQAALRLGAERITRPQLLAQLFNAAPMAIGVGGTSGKSTVTGMIGWILDQAGRDPVVMNGAVMKNYVTPETPFASALVGKGDAFVSEVDESDGSIALFRPKVAVLTNITLDHKEMDELRRLFLEFASKAEIVVLNLDDLESRRLADFLPQEKLRTFSFKDERADFYSLGVDSGDGTLHFAFRERGSDEWHMAGLKMWGAHNARNALAAIAAATAAGVSLEECIMALRGFEGLRRRFEIVGESNEIMVIDDFAHNPDKIAATLLAARTYLRGRLLLFFQPHGYGPLKQMGRELVATFTEGMTPQDVLIMPDPVYYGGTVAREVGSEDIVERVRASGRDAEHYPERSTCGDRLVALARPGDRIVVMGARDDTLSEFAAEVLGRIAY